MAGGASRRTPRVRAERPAIDAEYGITAGEKGLLPIAWARKRLRAARTYWVHTTRPDGRPHAMPVWGLLDGDEIVFSTGAGSVKAKNLDADPRVAVHVESGDEAVILEGRARRLGAPARRRLEPRYRRKYGSGTPPGSPWFAVRPRVGFAFRVGDYGRSATRYRF